MPVRGGPWQWPEAPQAPCAQLHTADCVVTSEPVPAGCPPQARGMLTLVPFGFNLSEGFGRIIINPPSPAMVADAELWAQAGAAQELFAHGQALARSWTLCSSQ